MCLLLSFLHCFRISLCLFQWSYDIWYSDSLQHLMKLLPLSGMLISQCLWNRSIHTLYRDVFHAVFKSHYPYVICLQWYGIAMLWVGRNDFSALYSFLLRMKNLWRSGIQMSWMRLFDLQRHVSKLWIYGLKSCQWFQQVTVYCFSTVSILGYC